MANDLQVFDRVRKIGPVSPEHKAEDTLTQGVGVVLGTLSIRHWPLPSRWYRVQFPNGYVTALHRNNLIRVVEP